MHPEAISDTLWELLGRLKSVPDMNFSYLGGGTALTLQLGHRKSDDLDFFVTEGFDELSFRSNIGSKGLDVFVVAQTSGHTEMIIQSVRFDLIKERIPLRFPLKTIHPKAADLKMADPRDIGRMKIISIGSRGSKKDFVDIYCLTRDVITLESLITMAMEENRGIHYSKLLFLKGLVDFEEADHEADPMMIWDISWEKVKSSLIKEVKKIAKNI